MITQIIESIV